jgi:phage tail sheath protein FI
MMPVTESRRTPGVYITERTGFPPSIVGVQTAVPAFIGYTERADINGKPVLFQPIKIGSLVDYQ